MDNYEKTQTGQEVEQGLKKAPGSAKKAYQNAKKIYKNKEKIKTVAAKGAQFVKWILIHLLNIFCTALQLILTAFGLPFLIAIILIFSATFALFSWNLDSFDSFDKFEESIGETCKITYSDTYDIIQENYYQKRRELADKVKEILAEKYGNDENHTFSVNDLSYECNNATGDCVITGSLMDEKDEDGDGYTDHIYVTNINYSFNVNDGSGGSLIDSIVGYIEANYTVIHYYNDNYSALQDTINQKTTAFVQFGKETKDGQTMTEDLCNSLGGQLYAKGCRYEYTPTTRTETKTGTCKYDGSSWTNSGKEGYECSTDEWKKSSGSTYETVTCKLNSSDPTNKKYVSEDGKHDADCAKLNVSGVSGAASTRKINVKKGDNDEPIDGSSYTYKYQKEIDLTDAVLEDFDLDIYKTELQEYVNQDKLFYRPTDESLNETVGSDEKTKVEKKSSSKTEEHKETHVTGHVCNASNGTVTANNEGECELAHGKWEEVTEDETIKVTVVTEETNITASDVALTIYTKIDADSSDNFLYEEKQTCLKNIEKLNKINDSDESADYTYSEAINTVVETINWTYQVSNCTDDNGNLIQISLNLITGASYSGFSAITSAIDAPEIFGNPDYWYDSSGGKGVWDYSQISRKDIYNAVWSYAATGAGTVSGWWNGHEAVGTPQCTDFVHARFFAQYGYQCGNGNGQDVARNTVAKYPDKFTNGVDANGKLNLKAGSIISKPGASEGNAYGHVGFIEAVEADSSGNITSITISDANFYKVPGGVRMHCVYTWSEFVSAWGQNCTFAVPIN